MITLKELFNKLPKEEVYAFYTKIVSKPKTYSKITRSEIYTEITGIYQEDPEIILKICNPEEINILRNILDDNYHNSNGYIEYVLLNNLINNYLVFEDNKHYYIPKDLINYVKMALNLYEEEPYYLKDITDSVILGLTRIHNVLKCIDFEELVKKYNVVFKDGKIKEYIKNNPRIKDKVKIIKHENDYYLVSLEFYYYKDVLKLLKNNINYPDLKLEEVISIGKYKINLFKEPIFKLLSFLEIHLEPKYIDMVIDELIVYTGFDIDSPKDLDSIANHIKELYIELMNVTPYFPIWIYKGNSLIDLK